MSQIAFHPVASEATSEEARQGRSELDVAIAADPVAAREGVARLFEGPRTPEALQGMATATVNAMAALVRGDWEINTLALHPTDYVFEVGERNEPLMIDFPSRLRGVEEYISGMGEFIAAWDAFEIATEGVAFGQGASFLQVGKAAVRGAGSGLSLETPIAFQYEWDGPWLVTQRRWWDVDLAMEEAGVDPATVLAVSSR